MIERLRELDEAATKGPWRARGGPQENVDYVLSGEHEDFLTGPLRRPNAALIAEVRSVLPEIIVALSALEQLLDFLDDVYWPEDQEPLAWQQRIGAARAALAAKKVTP